MLEIFSKALVKSLSGASSIGSFTGIITAARGKKTHLMLAVFLQVKHQLARKYSEAKAPSGSEEDRRRHWDIPTASSQQHFHKVTLKD